MPCYSAKRVCVAAILTLAGGTFATPQVVFPINSQIPPVAYATQPFEFTFSPTTFSSDVSAVSYILSNQPQWLSLDSATRTFSGTPTINDLGASGFEIVASDASGTITSNVTLVTLQQRRLFPDSGRLQTQLRGAGGVSTPATLLLHPEQEFGFSLTTDVFEGVSSSTAFYAVSSNGSPLPSWIQFDSSTLRFSGQSPPLLSPDPSEQVFSFKIAASNIAGFSEASDPFEVLISRRVLTFEQTDFNFTTQPGKLLQIPSLLSELQIDGVVARRDQIASTAANAPTWLNFNSSDLSFSGTTPDDATTSTFTLTANGLDSNSANTLITVYISGQQSTTDHSLGNVSATIDSYFYYAISKPLFLENITILAVSATDLPSWLSFNTTNLTLQGMVASDATIGMETISFNFTTASFNTTLYLIINVTSASATRVPSASITNNLAGATGTSASSIPGDEASQSGKRLATLVLAIILPILAMIVLIGIILAWVWNRRKEQRGLVDEDRTEASSLPPMQEIQQEARDPPTIADAILPYESNTPATNSVPQIELSWAPDSIKRKRNRLSKRPRASFSSIVGSSWDELIDFRVPSRDSLTSKPSSTNKNRRKSDMPTALQPFINRNSSQRPVRPARPASLFSQRPSEIFRNPRSHTIETPHAAGIPGRLSGAGHGAGGTSHVNHPDSRSSWQTTLGTIPRVDSRSDTAILNTFPEPPSQSSMNAISNTNESSPPHRTNARRTLRLVESSSGEAPSFDTARQKFFTQKARDQLEGTEEPSTAALGASFRSPLEPVQTSITRSPSWSKAINKSRYDVGIQDPGKTPPIPPKSKARERSSQTFNPQHQAHQLSNRPTINRELSIASSHQFDSAVSSDSQGDDPDLIARKYGTPNRLPLESRVQSRNSMGVRDGPESRPPRPNNQRKHISMADKRWERSEGSQRSSLRFV